MPSKKCPRTALYTLLVTEDIPHEVVETVDRIEEVDEVDVDVEILGLEMLGLVFDHLECTLPGDHGAEVVGKLEGVVTEVLHNAITTIDDGEETPASGMGDVVDLAHDLDDWLVEADL